jgi:O-antigen ligase
VSAVTEPTDTESAVRRRIPPVVRLALFVVFAALAGAAATTLPGRYAPLVIAAGPAALLAFALVRWAGPRWCLAALVFTTVLGWSSASTSAGRVNLRVTDIPYLAVLGWVLVIRARSGVRRVDIGQRTLAVFLAVLGISLLPILATSPHSFFDDFVSWARLVETFSIVWLVPYCVGRPSDRRFLIGVVCAACSFELGWAILHAAISGGLSGRLTDGPLGGGTGPDSLGLFAAILAVTVVHGGVPRRRWLRVSLFALALVSLGLTRSVGGVAAAGLVLGLAPISMPRNRRPWGALILPMRMALLTVALFATVSWLRPYDVPGSSTFGTGTANVRLIYGVDGIEQFTHHPILGVGFQQSSAPSNFANPAIVADLHRRFPNAMSGIIPNPHACTSPNPGAQCNSPTSVHNAYVQIAAESGLVGIAAFVVMVLAMGLRIRALGRRNLEPETARLIRWAVLLLIVLMIWWNDNPLYGGHAETVLAALALGTLATPWSQLSMTNVNMNYRSGHPI